MPNQEVVLTPPGTPETGGPLSTELFIELYETYWYKLFQTAYRRLQNRQVSEELVQDIFLDLWERRNTLEIHKIESYLFRAIKYAIIDHIRREVAQDNYMNHYKTFVGLQPLTQENPSLQDIPSLMEQGLDTLPEKSRNIFKLNHYHDWKKEKIASHFQLSEKAVEYHLTKSLKTLRVFLKNVAFGIIFSFLSSLFYL